MKSDTHMVTHMYTQSLNTEVRSGREAGRRGLEFHTYGHIIGLADLTQLLSRAQKCKI